MVPDSVQDEPERRVLGADVAVPGALSDFAGMLAVFGEYFFAWSPDGVILARSEEPILSRVNTSPALAPCSRKKHVMPVSLYSFRVPSSWSLLL